MRGDVVDDAARILKLTGQHQMTDDDAALHDAVPADAVRSDLTHHLVDGGGGGFKIVLRLRQLARRSGKRILEIGQIDLHLALKRAERFDTLVAAAVPHDGNAQRLFQRFKDPRRELRGGDEVDAVRALRDQLLHDRAQAPA